MTAKIDVEALQRDLEDAKREVDARMAELRVAGNRYDDAVARVGELEATVALVDRYMVRDADGETSGIKVQEATRLTGARATDAFLDFLSRHPGESFKVEAVHGALSREGWDGGAPALAQAASRLHKRGSIERVSKGYYRLPDDTHAALATAGSPLEPKSNAQLLMDVFNAMSNGLNAGKGSVGLAQAGLSAGATPVATPESVRGALENSITENEESGR